MVIQYCRFQINQRAGVGVGWASQKKGRPSKSWNKQRFCILQFKVCCYGGSLCDWLNFFLYPPYLLPHKTKFGKLNPHIFCKNLVTNGCKFSCRTLQNAPTNFYFNEKVRCVFNKLAFSCCYENTYLILIPVLASTNKIFNFFQLIYSGKRRHIFENQKRDGQKMKAVCKLARGRVQCIKWDNWRVNVYLYFKKCPSIHNYLGSILYGKFPWYCVCKLIFAVFSRLRKNKNVECMEWRGHESNWMSILSLYFARSLMSY